MLARTVIGIAVLALVGCGGKSDSGSTTPTTKPAPDKPTPDTPPDPPASTADGKAAVAAQVKAGEKSYAENCSGCHGDNGQGKKKTPAVIGDAALPKDPLGKRKATFGTAADVLTYIAKTMPKDDPGGLSKDDYAAVLAFMLTKSGKQLTGKLDEASAAKIVLNE